MRTNSDDCPLISVIVPIFKVEMYLDQCVESIVEQTYHNLEIILVDDGSSDACGVMCDEWERKDSRIRVIHKPNGGLSDARNAGLEICTGEYIMFVDSDDEVDRTIIEKLFFPLTRENADCSSACLGYSDEKTGEQHSLERDCFVCSGIEAFRLLLLEKGPPVSVAAKLYKSKLWNSVRFPVGKHYEDAFTTYNILTQCKTVVQIPDPLYYYRIRSGSISHSSFSLKLLDLQEAWKENYLFCKEKYPELENIARVNWLTYLPATLGKFPKEMTDEEKRAKAELKKEILKNLPFFISQKQPKKLYHQARALFY